ncbi:MAG TPA: hypothetical protein VHV55_05150 [Pirellulales bacterium]|nr:hypothetical protein [Pirellulales bacterium]
MHGRFHSRLLTAAILIGALASAARADEAKPSWACLPEDTLALVRVPSGNKVADALRTRTKLGAMLFDPGRIAKIRAAAKDGGDDFEAASTALGEYGLKLDDCYKLLEGEAGFGVLLPSGETRMVAVLAWLEPDAELTGRLMTALDKVLEDTKDEDLVKRTDIELAGQKVIQLTITPPDVEEDEVEVKPGEAKITIDQFDNLPQIEVLLTNKDGRLLSAYGVVIPTGDDEKADENQEAARDRLKDVFARFLVAHDDKDSGPKLRYLEAPGVKSSLVGGLPLVELMFDFRPLLKLLDMPEAKQVKQIVKACGLNQLGLVVSRMTLDKSLLRASTFISAPSPRAGLLGLLDQQTLSGQPPAWVPAEINSFSQVGFDLGKAYSRIKHIVIEQGGDAAREKFDQAELTVNQLLQTDIATLLSGMGNEHASVDLPPRKTDAAGNEGLAGLTGSNVFVWRLTDEALWKRIVQTASVFMQKELVEEQGFSGIRVDQGQVRLGLFVGRGYLVAGGGGSDTVETVLSNLRNPPNGSASLAGSKLFQRASELLPPRPCLSYSIADLNRAVKALRSALVTITDLAAGDEDNDRAIIELIRSVMPSEEELNGVLGVSTTQIWVDDHGVIGRSVYEVPAP